MSHEEFTQGQPDTGDRGDEVEATSNEPPFDYFAEARAHGSYLGLPQEEGESDTHYRDRVAGKLRADGEIVEAHEVASGRRWDDPEQGAAGPLAGIFGAAAQALRGYDYSPSDPIRQIGDDIAAGVVVTHQDPGREAIGAMFDLIGPAATMDIIDAFNKDK